MDMDDLSSSVDKVKQSLESDLISPGLLSAPAERVQMRRVSSLIMISAILIYSLIQQLPLIFKYIEWFGFTSDPIQFT